MCERVREIISGSDVINPSLAPRVRHCFKHTMCMNSLALTVALSLVLCSYLCSLVETEAQREGGAWPQTTKLKPNRQTQTIKPRCCNIFCL